MRSMRTKIRLNLVLISFIFLFQFPVLAQWQTDATYGMKINIPSNWTKKAYMDGTDQVYEYYSADQNVALQLRAFRADASLTVDMLIQVYEQAMLPAGTQRQSLNDHISVQGIRGKQAVYAMDYNGNGVAMAAFYTLQKGNAYVLTAIIPNQFLEQKSNEVKNITQSFTINGIAPVHAVAPTAAKVIPQTSSQGKGARSQQQNSGVRPGSQGSGTRPASSGSTTSSTASSSHLNIYGTYYFHSRSDGKRLTNNHFIQVNEDGTYEESYEPTSSPGYKGGHKGTWEKKNGKLYLNHNGGGVTDTYVIEPNELIRNSGSGLIFWFKK